MSLTESIVEDAALTWFGELGYSCLGAETLTPTLCLRPSPLRSGSQGERESYGEVVPSRFARILIPAFSQREKVKGEAIRQLNPAIPQTRTLATLRDTLLPKLLSGELSVNCICDKIQYSPS